MSVNLIRLVLIEKKASGLKAVSRCTTQPQLNVTSMTCTTVDVFETGMKLATGMAIPVATRLRLRLDVGLLIDDESQDFVASSRMFELDF